MNGDDESLETLVIAWSNTHKTGLKDDYTNWWWLNRQNTTYDNMTVIIKQ